MQERKRLEQAIADEAEVARLTSIWIRCLSSDEYEKR